MKNIWTLYYFEIRQNFRTFVIWFFALSAVLIFYMSFFPSMSNSDFATIAQAKVNAIPKNFGQAFGLTSSNASQSFQNILFYYSYIFQFVAIGITIYAINLGSNIIAKEHEDKHIEYLATKPIKKSHIILAKYKIVVTYLVLISLILAISGYGLISVFNKANTPVVIELLRMFIKLFFVYLFFGSLSFFITVIPKSTKKSNMLTLGIFFATFVVGIISTFGNRYENFRFLSPYYMFQAVSITSSFDYKDWLYIVVLTFLSLLFLLLTLWRYNHKDLA